MALYCNSLTSISLIALLFSSCLSLIYGYLKYFYRNTHDYFQEDSIKE